MNGMLELLSGMSRKKSKRSVRANQSPLSLLGLVIVITGTILFGIFGLSAMRHITELSRVLQADPETALRYVWGHSEIVIAVTATLTAICCAALIYHWHFYFQWEAGADISGQGTVRWVGMLGIACIYVALVWAVLLLGAVVGGETLAKAVLTAQSQAFNVLDELLAVVRQRGQSAGMDPQEIEEAVNVAFLAYDVVIRNENSRVKTAVSQFVKIGITDLAQKLNLTSAEFDRLAKAEIKNKCARQCLDLSLVPLVGSDSCICDTYRLALLGHLCRDTIEAFDRSIVGMVMLAIGMGILLVRTSFWFGITKFSKLPSTVPVHGIMMT